MNGISLTKVMVAIVISFVFMAAVRGTVEMAYPDGNDNLAKGRIAIITVPGTTVAKTLKLHIRTEEGLCPLSPVPAAKVPRSRGSTQFRKMDGAAATT